MHEHDATPNPWLLALGFMAATVTIVGATIYLANADVDTGDFVLSLIGGFVFAAGLVIGGLALVGAAICRAIRRRDR